MYQKIDKACFVDCGSNMQLSQFQNTFPYHHKIDVNDYNWSKYADGWAVYENIIKEAARQGIDFGSSEQFQLFDNRDFRLCATYPTYLVLPKSMSQKHIEACSKFRTKNRLPVMSYYHRDSGCSIWRSSQCMNGLMNNRKMEDELMVNEIGKTANKTQSLINNSRVVIYDARPWLSAEANRLKNGGFEKSKYYRNTEIIFCDIDNIHEVSKCFKKMQDITSNPALKYSSANYNQILEASDYMQFISSILKGINMVLDTIL
jgi:myotubularin-related protein 6/7/8